MAKNKKKSEGTQYDNENEQNENEKENKGDKISKGIAIVSLLVSMFSIIYCDKEYRYKLDPELNVLANIKFESYKVEESVENQVLADRIKIEILNKNNLEKAYLIYPNNVVEKLNVNDAENTLKKKLSEDIKLDNYDLNIGGWLYQYRFLFITGIDDSYELYLIYFKTDGKKDIVFNGVSGIEIWGLANSNNDNLEYEGERIMAKQYQKILKESSNYIK